MSILKDTKIKKFNNYDRALVYMNKLGYSYKSKNYFKEDRSELWTNKSKTKTAYLKSTFDFFEVDTMDMGTVWQVIEF